MLKLILCLTVIGASLSVGVFLSSRLNARIKILSELIVLIEEVSVKMTYTADPLAVLFNDNFAGYSFRRDQPFSQQFKEMTRKEGITILMTTHDVGLMGAADEILVAPLS